MTDPLAPYLHTASVPKADPVRLFVMSDLHLPYVDPPALRCAMKAICMFDPHELVLAGDIVDFYGISRYMKDPSRRADIQEDLDEAYDLLVRLRRLLPNAKITYIEGNHELRMHKDLCRRAAEYKALRALELPALLRLREQGVHWVPEDRFYEIGSLAITHGEFTNKYATNKYLTEYLTDLLAGHSHRMSSRYLHTFQGTYQAHEIGCLCSREAMVAYKKFPSLNHGWACAYVWPEHGLVQVSTHLVHDGLAMFAGRILDGREGDHALPRARRGCTRRVGRIRPR